MATVNGNQLKGIDRVPSNVRVVEWVPINHLLPTCSLHIHHGGNGTAMAAVVNKVPHIVTDTDESLLLREVQVTETPEFVIRPGTILASSRTWSR